MPPPLLTLQDIHLTFGGTPLLEGAELAIGERERVCLVGRNGSGKSTLLKIAAGTVEADRGARFAQPGATIRYLAQEPDLSGFATTLAYVEAGLAPGDDPHRARYLLEQLGLTGDEDPARLSGGEARRAALARVLAPAARHPAARRADQPSRPAGDRMAGGRARGFALGAGADQPRPALPRRSSRAPPSGSIAASRGASSTASRHSRNGAIRCSRRKSASSTSSAARSSPRSTGYATASRDGASATSAASACSQEMRKDFREHRGAQGKVKISVNEAELSGKLVAEADRISKSLRRDADRARLLDSHPARRPHRPRRPERRGQDDAAEDAHRRARARRRPGDARRELADGDARPAARRARSGYVGARHAHRRARRLACSSADRRATSSAT